MYSKLWKQGLSIETFFFASKYILVFHCFLKKYKLVINHILSILISSVKLSPSINNYIGICPVMLFISNLDIKYKYFLMYQS